MHDAAPPTVWLDVPRCVYSGSASIPLAWGAVDRDSGVAHYDLEVRIEEGAWQPVLTHTTATRHRFPLPPGSYFASPPARRPNPAWRV